MKNSTQSRQAGFAEVGLLVIGLAVLVVVGFFAYQNYQRMHPSVASTTVAHPLPAITKLSFASKLGTSGAAEVVSNTFAANTPAIYAVANVSTVGQKDRIEYVRYLNNKFVDNGSMALSKDGSHAATFAWNLNPGTTRPTGTYTVKVYANGKFIRESSYTVK